MRKFPMKIKALTGGGSLSEHFNSRGLGDVVFAFDGEGNVVVEENLEDGEARTTEIEAALLSYDGRGTATSAEEGVNPLAAMNARLEALEKELHNMKQRASNATAVTGSAAVIRDAITGKPEQAITP